MKGICLLAGCLFGWGGLLHADDLMVQRKAMTEKHLVARGIMDQRVLDAMNAVPREEFVPAELRSHAYDDGPLPIGHDQTISQPYIVAFMTQSLQAEPGHRVLEIGTGSGYQAAVLAKLVRAVYSIEIIEPLADRARETLARLGCDNIHVRSGDGYAGWPDASPFDRIIVTCAPDHVPPTLVEQLAEGGRMVIPVGKAGHIQELIVFQKKDNRLVKQETMLVRFVPMTGEAEQRH